MLERCCSVTKLESFLTLPCKIILKQECKSTARSVEFVVLTSEGSTNAPSVEGGEQGGGGKNLITKT
jgi:hypothetical protein